MLSLIQNLCLLLAIAHLLGRLAERLRQPPLLGHIVAGIALGPAALGWIAPSMGMNAVSDVAVLIVVIAAGLEMRLSSITSVMRGRGLLSLLPGMLIPMAMALLLARGFAFEWISATVIALCIAVTALPVALRILSGFGLIGTRLAQVTIAGALLTDLVVLLTLGVMAQVSREPATQLSNLVSNLALLAGGKLLLLIALTGAGAWLCKRIYLHHALQQRQLHKAQLSFSLLLILTLAFVSDWLGLHFAIGAFLGALIVAEYHSDTGEPHPLKAPMESSSHLLFAPVFLAAQGLHFTTNNFNQPSFVALLVVVAIVSKLLGGYWTGRLSGLSKHESQGTAIVMNARGLMEMVIASIAYKAQLIDAGLFATLLLVGCVTTVITPLMLRWWQKRSDSIASDIVTER